MRVVRDVFRHGLPMQWLVGQIKRLGLDINLYFLFLEGVRDDDMVWPDLAVEFSSEVLVPEEIPSLAACTDWATEERLRNRIDRGQLCVVLKQGDKLAGYTWADFDEVNDTACDYLLRPGEAYLYDAFIVPDYRGRGLAPYMRFECYKHLWHAGRYTFYSISDFFNKPAIRFKQKLRAKPVRLYLQIKVGAREVGQWMLRKYEE